MTDKLKCFVYFVLAGLCYTLAACDGKREVEGRYAFPASDARVIVEREPYGGGPGSLYKDVYFVNGNDREKIVAGRSNYPVSVTFLNYGKVVRVQICRGRVFASKSMSLVPYGSRKPVRVLVSQIGSCPDVN